MKELSTLEKISAFLFGALITFGITWGLYKIFFPREKNIAAIQAPFNSENINLIHTFEEIKTAAENGISDAQFILGLMYYEEQNYSEAAEWYRKAAEQGNAKAQFNLGNKYYEGKGVKQDYKEAFKWYKKAAEQGHAQAQFNLGCMYGRGEGVSKNYFEVNKWLTKSARQGNQDAQEFLKKLKITW